MGKNVTTEHVNDVMNSNVADSLPMTTIQDLKRRTQTDDQTAYVIADAFTADPFQLLGQVVIIKSKNGECPSSHTKKEDLAFQFHPSPISGIPVSEKSRLAKPELRGSVIVDNAITLEAGFLNYLSFQLKENETFSLMIMDQAKGLVDFQNETWAQKLDEWCTKYSKLISDPNICYIYVVTGFVQKNIIKKKYREFVAGARGGAYGISVNGKLSTSNDEYSLDIIFGLTPAIIKSPDSDFTKRSIDKISPDHARFFAEISGGNVPELKFGESK